MTTGSTWSYPSNFFLARHPVEYDGCMATKRFEIKALCTLVVVYDVPDRESIGGMVLPYEIDDDIIYEVMGAVETTGTTVHGAHQSIEIRRIQSWTYTDVKEEA